MFFRFSEYVFLLLLVMITLSLSEDPVVTIAQGKVRGKIVEPNGRIISRYYVFEGIPYAAAPVGAKRFKDPEEPESWNGIRNATHPGSVCLQRYSVTGEVEGEEDCLFINIYTSASPTSQKVTKLPVVVWLHPFLTPSGDMDWLRPDAILGNGVIVVSFNYRLGALGNLNTEDSDAPGNAAIKDAVMALRWIQKNIEMFGGDSKKVTVFGDGVGGTIVSYLLLSPQHTKGLLHRAMSMSGSALGPWSYIRHPRQYAVSLWELFKSSCPNDTGLLSCLQSIGGKDLVRSEEKVLSEEVTSRFWKNPFVASIEAPGSSDSPFLTTEPEQSMRSGNFLKVPYITGFTTAEGIFPLWTAQLLSNESRWQYIQENFEDTFQWMMPPGLKTKVAVQEMRNFYLGERTLVDAQTSTDTIEKFVKMCTDLLVAVSSVSAARLMTENGAKVYVYEFAYEGDSYLKRNVYNASNVPGVAHGEDLFYLFLNALNDESDESLLLTTEERSVRERWVQHFTDFAKWGFPTPSLFGVSEWKPYSVRNEYYLLVDKIFTLKDHVLKKQMHFWRQLAGCPTAEVCEEHPLVYTQQGYVRGRRQKSVAGCDYYSWQGIPYAKPPIGPLRFKDAEYPDPWEGIRDALKEGAICPQAAKYNLAYLPDLTTTSAAGDDDCLFLNVYSPHLPTWLLESLPVMHWIHAGAFVTGSGNQDRMGPDYMICEDVVMTTFNYRVGPFGFLYLEEAAPGNAGLKDQLMALRWVRTNVVGFLGLSNKVTVAGVSAGAASVHFHMLSPLTKGLFHQAIANSGNAIDRFAIQTAPLETSMRLAEAVGCEKSDSFAVVECLRNVSMTSLILAALDPALTPEDRGRFKPYTFVPTNDYPTPGVELFLPEPSIDLVRSNAEHDVGFLTGFTSRESLIDLVFEDFLNETVANAVDAMWEEKIWTELSLPADSDKEPPLTTLRQFFMDGKSLSNDTVLQFMDMLTDIQFAKAVYYNLELLAKAKKGPIYEYMFDVDDRLNRLKFLINATEIPGAEHESDLNYLFRIQGLPEVVYNSSAALARRRMVRLWTNYVKFGNPTANKDPLLQDVEWKPYTSHEKNYLYIGAILESRNKVNENRAKFWRKFYNTYGT